jgi:hypothetical protein
MPQLTSDEIDALLKRFTRGFYTPRETKPLKQAGYVEWARPGSLWCLTEAGRKRAQELSYF